MRTSTHSLRRTFAAAIAVTVLAAPAASAAPIDETANPSGRQQAEAYSAAPLELPSAPVPASGAGNGFDWGDAGIGATAMLALAAIAAGAAVAVGHRPGRRHTVA